MMDQPVTFAILHFYLAGSGGLASIFIWWVFNRLQNHDKGHTKIWGSITKSKDAHAACQLDAAKNFVTRTTMDKLEESLKEDIKESEARIIAEIKRIKP